MEIAPLPFRAPLASYRKQAEDLLDGWRTGDDDAVQLVRTRHPRFLNARIPWLPLRLSDAEVRGVSLELPDAQLALARWYDFQNWAALTDYAEAVTRENSAVFQFESAVEAVTTGDAPALRALLREHPELVRARSTRVTHFDPPVHAATLLHYVAANGVEGHRQKSPVNAAEIARVLLEAGAEADALADMYGGRCTTMSMLVSSSHPAEAGVQIPLIDTLLDFGAALEERGGGNWTSPLMTALAFGFEGAARALVRRGARVDTLPAAAGLGRFSEARELLATAGAEDRHRALALAAQQGNAAIVKLLLDAGEDPNRYNPKRNHGHATPLHQAVAFGHLDVVRLLVERGARLDMKDLIHESTPLGWAEYGRHADIAAYLRGAPLI